MKKTVLLLSDYYLPGHKAGGPIQTLANIVNRLDGACRFRVMTRDRDLGDTVPYAEVEAGRWVRSGGAEILYVSPGIPSLLQFCRTLMGTDYDVLHINSFFSFKFSIFPLLLLRLGLIRGKVVIVAPRGECAKGALRLKATKKRIFLAVAALMGLHNDLLWHASSRYEAEDIVRVFGDRVRAFSPSSVVVAPDLPKAVDDSRVPAGRAKIPGRLSIIFVGRIVKMKNLDFALKVLSGLRGDVSFNIYGPMEDKLYWDQCSYLAKELESNITVTYHGVVDHDTVCEQFTRNDVMLLPTLGENFGHVIIESLSVGCPVVISDRTLWRNLERDGVGWDIPLECPEIFHATLQQLIDMDGDAYGRLSTEAFRYGVRFANSGDIVKQSIDLYHTTPN